MGRVDSKPSSVVGNYLSSCKITLAIKPSFEVMCRANNPSVDVAVNRVYMAGDVSTPSVSSYLAFPPLPAKYNRRYISVALSLRSPSAAVSRYPALRSPDFPHQTKCFKRDRPPHSQKKVYSITVKMSNIKIRLIFLVVIEKT